MLFEKNLDQLIQEIEPELVRLGYTKGSIQFYQRMWKKLQEFATQRNEVFFSEELGIDFIEKILKRV